MDRNGNSSNIFAQSRPVPIHISTIPTLPSISDFQPSNGNGHGNNPQVAMLSNGNMTSTTKRLRFSTKDKMQRMLKQLSTSLAKRTPTSASASASATKPYGIDTSAAALLQSYAEEVTCAVLESAATLAKHRKSSEVTHQDVNLMLVKKLTMEVASFKVKTHMQQLKASPTPSQLEVIVPPTLPQPSSTSSTTTLSATTSTTANSSLSTLAPSSSSLVSNILKVSATSLGQPSKNVSTVSSVTKPETVKKKPAKRKSTSSTDDTTATTASSGDKAPPAKASKTVAGQTASKPTTNSES